ncbi:hypothetical protein [Streptomyces sp. NPDC058247]|uniref:hypothetical protein n=1 Tax=Streptomyces sp. NPDC058247 TaxID=3346401 RepID=UPI0036F0ECE2
MTAITGKPDIKQMDRWFATTNRLHTEGTDHLLAAAEATGVAHFVAQSYASWNGVCEGGWVKTEEECAGAKPPVRVPEWVARLLAEEVAVSMMTEGRGFSNAKAKRELGWELRHPSWRQIS